MKLFVVLLCALYFIDACSPNKNDTNPDTTNPACLAGCHHY